MGRAQRIFRAVKAFYDIMMDTCLHICPNWVERTIPRASPNVKYGLSVISMYPRRFIRCNKCTALVRDADDGGGCAYMGAVSILEISLLSILL